jgi:hypothetical protein
MSHQTIPLESGVCALLVGALILLVPSHISPQLLLLVLRFPEPSKVTISPLTNAKV